jgi:2-dehydropantoate 2-reductase
MRIAVIGAGGVGGYFGGRLAQGGADVVFVAHGVHLEAMREDGLRIESRLGNLHLPEVTATDDLGAGGLPTADLVLIAVKLADTDSACRVSTPLVGPNTAVVSFQNGVDKDNVLRAAFGGAAVLGGVAYIGARIARPGVIAHTGTMQRLIFGEFDGSHSERCTAFLTACQAGGIDAELTEAIELREWEKFAMLAATSAITTATRSTLGPLLRHPRSRSLLRRLMEEVVAVGRARGVMLTTEFPKQQLAYLDSLPPEMDSSMHEDLRRGRKLELPFLSGAVMRMGTELGIPTPAHAFLCDALAIWEDGSPVMRDI